MIKTEATTGGEPVVEVGGGGRGEEVEGGEVRGEEGRGVGDAWLQ